MRILSNKKGSALLWCILLIIILTILLSSVLTAVYTYYNYTMKTVKRQQAYFTARSAVSVILEELTSEEQVAVNGEYNESSIAILPSGNGEEHKVEITDFDFMDTLGAAEATLIMNHDDEIAIKVTSYYPDREKGEKYVLNATVMRQPVYFGGIAVKNLELKGDLELGENTDLYWNSEKLFKPSGNGISFAKGQDGSLVNNSGSHKIKIRGNLVTKGNAEITSGTIVASRKFNGTAIFSKKTDVGYLRSKKIWSPSEYIISNTTLRVDDAENTEYTSTILNTLRNITNYKPVYCNSNGNPNVFGRVSITGTNFSPLLSALGLGNILTDLTNDALSITNSSNDALSIKYIKVLSASTTMRNAWENYKRNLGFIGRIVDATMTPLYDNFISRFTLSCLDASYIDFTATDENNRTDNVVPLTYLLVEGGPVNGMKVRVRYGTKPEAATQFKKIVDNFTTNAASFIGEIFDIHNKFSYTVVYLEENATIELGYDDDGQRLNNPEKLVFPYSIYGGENTTVILHDGVTVTGEIICDHLITDGNAKVIYSSINGSQVAKQKIAEYWAVSNYSD